MRARGYRKRRRHQKRKKMLKNCFMAASAIAFAVLLFAVIVVARPTFIVSRVLTVYNDARLLLTNTISDLYINLKVSDTVLNYMDFSGIFLK